MLHKQLVIPFIFLEKIVKCRSTNPSDFEMENILPYCSIIFVHSAMFFIIGLVNKCLETAGR